MSPEQKIEFGLKEVAFVPWTDLNILTQTRTGFDQAGLDELTRSIEALDEHGKPRFEMLHPPLVNILNPGEARQYVDDLNTCYDTKHTIDELRPNEDGNYAIVVAGHRRRMAAGALISKYDADPTLSTVACNVRTNMSFDEALRLQIQENTHLQLPVYEVARAIQANYRYGLKTGHYNSMADCVRELPFGEDKIRTALKFCELPNFMQEWVEDDYLKYGAAVALHPLVGGLREYYGKRFEDPQLAEEIAIERLTAIAFQIMTKKLGRDSVAQIVKTRLDAMRQESDLVLFVAGGELAAARSARNEAYRELFDVGIGRLRQFTQIARGKYFTDLPLEQREAVIAELAEMHELFGSLALKQEVMTAPGFFDD